ncbi:MAG: twin-arginine translocase TatA/TatE family subunit [Actinobacteria bacterium]|nr:twin-arginine translocase TatA/TatE family subunit [Actinomycetota bacterium]
MLGNIGPLEIGIVLVVALLVFGPKRLPELGSGLGRGIRDFKTGIEGRGEESEAAEPAAAQSSVTSTVRSEEPGE